MREDDFMAVTNCVVGVTDSGKEYEGRYSTSDDFLRGCRTVKGLNGPFKYMMGVSRQDASAALLVIEPRDNQCVKAYSFKGFPTNVDSNVVLHKAVALFERDNPRFHACSELAEEIESRYDKAFNAFKDLYYSFGMKDSDIRGFEAGDKNPDEMFNRVAYGKNLYSMTSDQMEAYLYDSIAELGDVQCISDDEICKYCPSVSDYLPKDDDFTVKTAYSPAKSNPLHNGIADKPVKEQVKYFPNASVVEIHNVSAKLLGNTSVDDIKTFSVPGSSKGAFMKFIVPATFITQGEKPSRFDITMPDGWMLTSADKQGTSYLASQVKEMYQTALSEYASKKRRGKSKQVSTVGRSLPSCSDVSSEPDDEYNSDIDM